MEEIPEWFLCFFSLKVLCILYISHEHAESPLHPVCVQAAEQPVAAAALRFRSAAGQADRIVYGDIAAELAGGRSDLRLPDAGGTGSGP